MDNWVVRELSDYKAELGMESEELPTNDDYIAMMNEEMEISCQKDAEKRKKQREERKSFNLAKLEDAASSQEIWDAACQWEFQKKRAQGIKNITKNSAIKGMKWI